MNQLNDLKYVTRFALIPVRVYDHDYSGWIWLKPYYKKYKWLNQTWVAAGLGWSYQGNCQSILCTQRDKY